MGLIGVADKKSTICNALIYPETIRQKQKKGIFDMYTLFTTLIKPKVGIPEAMLKMQFFFSLA